MHKGRFFPQCIPRLSPDMAVNGWAPRRIQVTFVFDWNGLTLFGDPGNFSPLATIDIPNLRVDWSLGFTAGGLPFTWSVRQQIIGTRPGIEFTCKIEDAIGGFAIETREWQIGQVSWGNPFFEFGFVTGHSYAGLFTRVGFFGGLPKLYH